MAGWGYVDKLIVYRLTLTLTFTVEIEIFNHTWYPYTNVGKNKNLA